MKACPALRYLPLLPQSKVLTSYDVNIVWPAQSPSCKWHHRVSYHISSYKAQAIIILHSLQMRVLLENTTFLLHKIVRIAGIIRVVDIIQGRALYEEIQHC